MIKFGKRKNLIYLSLLILFIALRRIESIILKKIYKVSGNIILSILVFFSKFIVGVITYFSFRAEKIILSKKHYSGTILIKSDDEFIQADKWYKIMILIFFASYFDFIGTIVRKLCIKKSKINTIDTLEQSIRSFQVVSSAVFCMILSKIPMYKHQIISLIIITACLLSIIFVEFTCINNLLSNKLISIGLTSFSCVGRALLDTVEKYLFEYNYMNPFLILLLEGLINMILSIPLFLFLQNPPKDIKKLNEQIFVGGNYFLIVLFLLYIILTMFKNIYRVVTIKVFSPMTRALAESILDPFIVVYYMFNDDGNSNKYSNFWVYCGVIILCSIIMPFSSCLYNEFIVLFCCGLEHETHIEIIRRGTLEDSPLSLNTEGLGLKESEKEDD